METTCLGDRLRIPLQLPALPHRFSPGHGYSDGPSTGSVNESQEEEMALPHALCSRHRLGYLAGFCYLSPGPLSLKLSQSSSEGACLWSS